MTDITAQRASEQQLLRIAAALNQSTEAIIITDAAGRVEYLNQSYERMFGQTLASLNHSCSELFTFDCDADHCASEVLRNSKEQGLPCKVEARCVTASGAVVDLSIQLAPLRGLAGELQYCVYVVSDISAELKLKSQLIHAQKMESIGLLASGVAHEINTPTQYIGDNLRFILEIFEELLPPLLQMKEWASAASGDAETPRAIMSGLDVAYYADELPKAIQESLEGNSRVASIVGAMKAFAHPDDEEYHAENINSAIENTLMVARNEWKYVAVATLDLDPKLPHVPCQLGAINQVILNLIVNAAHAIAERREKESISEKGVIHISTSSAPPWAEIKISDTGAGLPESLFTKIFDPFFTTKGVGKGTGQGLSIAHGVVVERHHGHILVESTVGQGSCFTVRLPLQSE